MKNFYLTLQVILCCCIWLQTAAQQIAVTPDNFEAGGINQQITITGIGTEFVPGMTSCVIISSNFSNLSVSGSATSNTEFSGVLTVPIFTATGSYDVTIYQGPLCSGVSWSCTDCVTICAQKNILGSPIPASCFGCSDGGVNLNVFGGVPPYTFNWSNGATTQSLAGVTAGDYMVSITDFSGCLSEASYTVTQPEPLTSTPFNGTQGASVQMTISGSGTGFIPGTTSCAEISNGSQTYSFSGNAASETIFSGDLNIPANALAGLYNVAIYEGPGCSGTTWGCTDCFNICIPMNISGVVSNATCTGCPNGSIDVSVTGGTPPYQFNWSNGTTFEDASVLSAGPYSVTVTDLAGCTDFASFSVGEPDPITVTPNNLNPGTMTNLAIIGSGTDFLQGTTTCAEFRLGNEYYQITGTASSSVVFNGAFSAPFDATPGNYDITVFQGPDCGGVSWSCSGCFTVVNPFICGGTYYDIGGPNSDYPNSTSSTQTICPDTPGDVVTITFNNFSLENNGTGCYDALMIYDGADELAPVIPSPGGITPGWCWDRDDAIANGSGDLQGQSFSSTDISGCLTFSFTSDPFNSREGWNASIACDPRLDVVQPSGDPGTIINSTINGVGTNFTPGMTTCAEFTKGGTVLTATGDALDETHFDFFLDLPINAPSGLYDVTVYVGPGCGLGFTGNSWTCTDCFEVMGTNFPVEWLFFNAESRQTEVFLTWATATEINTSHFDVQHSRDGVQWETIETAGAAGNATEVSYYSAVDRTPFSGTNYYRIRQVDLDESFTYSEVQAVKIEVTNGLAEVRPNPAIDDVTLMIISDGIEHVNLTITNVNGKLMHHEIIELQPGVNNIDLDLSQWVNGMYFIEIEGNQKWSPAKLIKI